MWVKICGVTTPADAEAAVEAGADALGLNFVPSSPRYLSLEQAKAIIDQVRGRVELVGVVANLDSAQCRSLLRAVGVDRLQLHGEESVSLLAELGPSAFKAVGIASPSDVSRAASYSGDRILVDARIGTQVGGTGHVFEWSWVAELAKRRSLVLAGGLGPSNVARAIAMVSPFGVDTASGVESAQDKRAKDPEKMRRFVAAARAAAATEGAS